MPYLLAHQLSDFKGEENIPGPTPSEGNQSPASGDCPATVDLDITYLIYWLLFCFDEQLAVSFDWLWEM